MGYYDIDDILSESTRIPCRFNAAIPGLAYLEGNPTHPENNTSNTIKKGTRLDLPVWLAEFLAVCTIPSSAIDNEVETDNDTAFIELLPPTYISSQILNALKSSPTSIPLNTVLKHFYAFVEKWATLFNDEELIAVITEVLKARVDEINNFAQVFKGSSTGAGNGGVDFIAGLDEFEKTLFKEGNESYRDVRKWLRNES